MQSRCGEGHGEGQRSCLAQELAGCVCQRHSARPFRREHAAAQLECANPPSQLMATCVCLAALTLLKNTIKKCGLTKSGGETTRLCTRVLHRSTLESVTMNQRASGVNAVVQKTIR